MATTNKARKASKDNTFTLVGEPTVEVSETGAELREALRNSTALTLLPAPVYRDDAKVKMDDEFWTNYRKAIRAKFSGSAKFVDMIGNLGLTSEDKVEIEALRVEFFNQWIELIFGQQGETEGKARKMREEMLVKGADRKLWDTRRVNAYNATKVAWGDIKTRADLKAAPKKREASPPKGDEGKGASEGGAIEPSKIENFEHLCSQAFEVSKLLEALVAASASIKSCGLRTVLLDCSKSIKEGIAAAIEGSK